MTYHRALGMMPAPIPTAAYTQSIEPYAMRVGPPGGLYAPYGWGPGSFVGMPMNYSHHMGYERTPLRPGTYDRLGAVPTALDRKLAALQAAERRYRGFPSAATYMAYRQTLYAANPNAGNLAALRSAQADSRAADAAVTSRGGIAPLRILRPGSYGRLSGLGAVLAIV